jgi:OPA family sugar phosphate sensor protein UhpC-like MFS transporter
MVLTLCGVYFFLKPIRYAVFRWMPMYISEAFGTKLGETALISVCFELAGPLGVLSAGYISDKWFQSRRMPISIVFLFCLGLVLFLFHHLAGFHHKGIVAGLLFLTGFFLYGPDSLVSGTAAIDFGTKKGASTAAGFINGAGSIGAILGGSLPGVIAERWGWGVLFTGLGVSVCLAGLLLLPKWNALPGQPDST